MGATIWWLDGPTVSGCSTDCSEKILSITLATDALQRCETNDINI